jgi:hypothetical protein
LLNMVPSCSMEASICLSHTVEASTTSIQGLILCSTRREVLLISHSTL